MAQVPLVQDRVPLNEVKFAGRDFPSIFDALLRRLKGEYGDVYNDFAESPQGIMLIDLCAYAAAQVCWTLDRLVSDCYLSTVRTPMPASWLARMLGYKMTAAAAAGADLTLTFAAGVPGNCTLGAGWKFQGPSAYQYELLADIALPPTGVPLNTAFVVTAAVRQGQTRQLSYVGDGTAYQQYNLEYASTGEAIADGCVRVWVDGLEWTEVEFLEYAATAQFEVDYQAVPPYVRFGDGKAGQMPPDGADIRIQFVKIVGAQGNVKAHTITTSLDALSVLGSAVAFTVDNDLPARSGRDAETVDHARRVAPYAFAARGGAVTLTDYQAQANGYVDALYGSVTKAYAFTPRTTYDDIVFNSMEDTIRAFVTAFEAATDAALVACAADLAILNASVVDAEAARSTMEGLRTTLLGSATAILASLATAKGLLIANAGNYSTASTAIDGIATEITATLLWGVGAGLSPGQMAGLSARMTAMQELQTTAKAAVDAMNTGDASAKAAVEAAEAQGIAMQPVLEDTTGSLAVQLAAQQADLAAMAAPLADIAVQVAAMDAAGAALEAGIDPVLVSMAARIGEIFDDSCRSNLVQVPILSVDTDGNYIAPPSGLMISLQNHLDGLKEVTQHVEVLDGSLGLLTTNITIAVKVSVPYVAAEVVSAIDATVRGIMRGREYAQALYLSDLYRYVRSCSDGVEYVTISIDEPAAYISGGNVFPGETQILVLGTLTITEVP